MSANQSRSRPDSSPVAVTASDGVALPGPGGQHLTLKISGAASYGAYSLIEHSHAPGAPGPPAHLHRDRHDTIFTAPSASTASARDEQP